MFKHCIFFLLLSCSLTVMHANAQQFTEQRAGFERDASWFGSWSWRAGRAIRDFFTETLPVLPQPEMTPQQYVRANVDRRSAQSILQYLLMSEGLSYKQALSVALTNSPDNQADDFLLAAMTLAPVNVQGMLASVAASKTASHLHPGLLNAALNRLTERSEVEAVVAGFIQAVDVEYAAALVDAVMTSPVGVRNPQILAVYIISRSKGLVRAQAVVALEKYLDDALHSKLVQQVIAEAEQSLLGDMASVMMRQSRPEELSDYVSRLLAVSTFEVLPQVLEAVAVNVSDEQLMALSPVMLAAIPADQRQQILLDAHIKLVVEQSEACCDISPDFALVMNALHKGKYQQQMADGSSLYLPDNWANMMVALLGDTQGRALVTDILHYIGADTSADQLIDMAVVASFNLPDAPVEQVYLVSEPFVPFPDEGVSLSLLSDTMPITGPAPVSPD